MVQDFARLAGRRNPLMSEVLKRIRLAAVLSLVIGTSGEGEADVLRDLNDSSGGLCQAVEFGQVFINGAAAEVIKTIQIQATFGTVVAVV
jgi:hypothetical protein